MPYKNIESWASSIGYVVEDNFDGYVWYKEGSVTQKKCRSADEVMDQILEDIRSNYQGER